ncbi:hypothetical protein [Agrobacterium cavarae]|uniref:hypothetical protein n=1 Tax=Agrobacterium cavarae TaxID=2528239 RepID=UPI002FDAE41C
METALIVVGSLISLAGGVLSYPLAEMIDDFQGWSTDHDQSTILKAIETYEMKLEKAMKGDTLLGNLHLTGSLFGLFAVQKINASAYNRLHQANRRRHGLVEYSLEAHPGIIDRSRVLISFDEIRAAIKERKENFEKRNTRVLSLALVVVGSLMTLGAALV